MSYFAIVTDEGIVVKEAESRDHLAYPNEWREIHDIHRHANERGLAELARGKRMVFTQDDQSYPELMSLFYKS